MVQASPLPALLSEPDGLRQFAALTLVNGDTVPPNGQVTVTIDERADFLDGRPMAFPIDGKPVAVVFTKLSDIPIPPSMSFSNPANSGLLPLL